MLQNLVTVGYKYLGLHYKILYCSMLQIFVPSLLQSTIAHVTKFCTLYGAKLYANAAKFCDECFNVLQPWLTKNCAGIMKFFIWFDAKVKINLMKCCTVRHLSLCQ